MLEIWTLSILEVPVRTLNRWFSRQEERHNRKESDAAQGGSSIKLSIRRFIHKLFNTKISNIIPFKAFFLYVNAMFTDKGSYNS